MSNTARDRRAWVVGFEDQLCNRGRCSSTRDGRVMYRTVDHLSVQGALALTGRFATGVISHARAAPQPATGNA
jgi:hypothetical protein